MEGEKKSGSHVLVLPFPIQGHINPMLQFAKRLASKGLKVTLVTTSSSPAKSLQNQATCNINVESIFDGFQEGQRPSIPDEYIECYKATVPGSLTEFIKKHNETQLYPFKCLIYDSVFPAAFDVAKSLGLQGCPFFTQTCAVTAMYYHNLQGLLKYPLEEPVVCLPSLPELEFNDLPTMIYSRDSYPAISDLVYDQFLNIDQASWLLWNTFYELEDEVIRLLSILN